MKHPHGTAIYHCPIEGCNWEHAEPPPDPRATDPNTLASVFEFGFMSAVFAQQRSARLEEALDKHFRTHTLTEWVATVGARDRQLREANRKIEQLQELCNKLGMAMPEGGR